MKNTAEGLLQQSWPASIASSGSVPWTDVLSRLNAMQTGQCCPRDLWRQISDYFSLELLICDDNNISMLFVYPVFEVQAFGVFSKCLLKPKLAVK